MKDNGEPVYGSRPTEERTELSGVGRDLLLHFERWTPAPELRKINDQASQTNFKRGAAMDEACRKVVDA